MATLAWLVVVVVGAVVLVVPSLILIFRLDQLNRLEEVHELEVLIGGGGPRPAASAPRVVIVGGGFAGVAAAKALSGAPVRVTLVDRTNYHLFQPLLYQVAAGVLEPGTIAAPIRSMFRRQPNIEVLMATVVGIDTDTQRVVLDGDQPPLP
jgi:NADPH-dependent 2,4-dienoyl-CoA reductase/sulfur reductase-like enzyme